MHTSLISTTLYQSLLTYDDRLSYLTIVYISVIVIENLESSLQIIHEVK